MPLGAARSPAAAFLSTVTRSAAGLGVRQHYQQQMDVSGDRELRARFLCIASSNDDVHLSRLAEDLDSVFERGIRLAEWGMASTSGVEPDAAEKRSGFARTDSCEVSGGVRRLEFPICDHEGSADDLQRDMQEDKEPLF